MNQLSIFDLMPAATPAVTKIPTAAPKTPQKGVADVAPLESSVLECPSVEWISYALAKLKSGDKGYYCLVLPLAHPDDDVEFIRECFTSAGIDPYRPWEEQMAKLKPAQDTYGRNEICRYGFGNAGNINGGYAIKPVCPFCGREVEMEIPLLGDKPFERVCAVKMTCGHTAVAGMVFLPDYSYAQQVFEVFSFKKH